MRNSIYPRLAVTNIKNNRKTYLPYLLTATLTVMMFYLMDALSKNKSIGDGSLQMVMEYAVGVVIIFAVIFLFYTNSFLIKRRKKEIGVYHILGMEKRHIAKMLSLETLIIAVTSIIGGVIGGIVFSRLMYLLLLKILHYDVGMEFEVPLRVPAETLLLFVFIFLLTLIYNMMQIQRSNPVELLQGGNAGEKEPKTKWMLTIVGVLLMGYGYYVAVVTESPLEAMSKFFIAVACVIIGTYALFTAGSIALLKLLRKNKTFYYKTSHFSSVSGMIYRMKQNAVGLANICILSTMVLVMISTTVSLYMGMDDMMTYQFPREFTITSYGADDSKIESINQIVEEELSDAKMKTAKDLAYRGGEIVMSKKGENFLLNDGAVNYSRPGVCEVYLIPQEDYNHMEGAHITLTENEVAVYSLGGTYGKDTVTLDGKKYDVARELKTMKVEEKNRSRVVPAYYFVFSEEEQIQKLLEESMQNDNRLNEKTKALLGQMQYYRSFDLKGSKKADTEVMETLTERLAELGVKAETRELHWENSYILFGGLLFIGIYLGVMFLMATVLIIYYKQISEGFDDKERYHIMKKVGMSKKEVKSSIKSQILTVFFLPLIVAIIHIAFAFPVVTKLLATLNFVNVPLFLACTVVTVLVFALFYAIVYGITAREYYKIVN